MEVGPGPGDVPEHGDAEQVLVLVPLRGFVKPGIVPRRTCGFDIRLPHAELPQSPAPEQGSIVAVGTPLGEECPQALALARAESGGVAGQISVEGSGGDQRSLIGLEGLGVVGDGDGVGIVQPRLAKPGLVPELLEQGHHGGGIREPHGSRQGPIGLMRAGLAIGGPSQRRLAHRVEHRLGVACGPLPAGVEGERLVIRTPVCRVMATGAGRLSTRRYACIPEQGTAKDCGGTWRCCGGLKDAELRSRAGQKACVVEGVVRLGSR